VDIPVKSPLKSKTVWLNIAAVFAIFYLPEDQLREWVALLPILGDTDDPKELVAILTALANLWLRSQYTNQPVTVTAALRPVDPGTTVTRDTGVYLVQKRTRDNP
jgi:hypothetical protein